MAHPFHQISPTEVISLYSIGRDMQYLEDVRLYGLQQPQNSGNCRDDLRGEPVDNGCGQVDIVRRGVRECSRLAQPEEGVKVWCNKNVNDRDCGAICDRVKRRLTAALASQKVE